jgi:hypothetical protein
MHDQCSVRIGLADSSMSDTAEQLYNKYQSNRPLYYTMHDQCSVRTGLADSSRSDTAEQLYNKSQHTSGTKTMKCKIHNSFTPVCLVLNINRTVS